MERLNEKKWKAFPIDAEFRMKKKGNVPTGALVSDSVLKDGMYPRIRVTSQNNGINGFTNVCDEKNYRAYSNFVSMSFLGNAFYHPYTASLDMKVHCLQYKDTELNPAMGLFTVTMAERIASGTNYGNQLSSNDMAAKQILLPVDDKGKPDYAYMTHYSTEMRGGCSCGIRTSSLGSSPSWNTRIFRLLMRRNGMCLVSVLCSPRFRRLREKLQPDWSMETICHISPPLNQ